MYTYEQRKKAVELYIKYGFALRAVIRELGYPTCEQSIRNWYREYREKGELSQQYVSSNQYTLKLAIFNATLWLHKNGKLGALSFSRCYCNNLAVSVYHIIEQVVQRKGGASVNSW